MKPRRLSLSWILLIGTVILGVIAFLLLSPEKAQPLEKKNITPVITATADYSKLPATPTAWSQTPLPCNRIGQTWGAAIDQMVLVCVPAGNFSMGVKEKVNVTEPHEGPQHIVYLDSFWMDQTEVSNKQYQGCVNAGKCTPPSKDSTHSRSSYYGNPAYDHYPVVYVTWHQANAYCQWAGRRLPTEAEWEKAARGEDGRPFPWGERVNAQKANYARNWGDTTPVNGYPEGASLYGVLNMAGNVWEWVADRYGATYYAASPNHNPTGPEQGDLRVMRGGSYLDDYATIRSSNRGALVPETTDDYFGFRCAY